MYNWEIISNITHEYLKLSHRDLAWIPGWGQFFSLLRLHACDVETVKYVIQWGKTWLANSAKINFAECASSSPLS